MQKCFRASQFPCTLELFPAIFQQVNDKWPKRISPFNIASDCFFDARLVSYFDEGFSSKCNRFTPRNHGHRTIGTNRAESWSNLGKYSRLSLPGLQTFYANIIALRHSNEGVFQLVSTHNCSDATMTGAMCLFYHNWPRGLAETLYNQHK